MKILPINFKHPLVAERKLRTLFRFIKWQIKSRIFRQDFIHCWVAGTLDSRNVEVVDDNEDPSTGSVWLPGIVMSCMRAALTNVQFGRGGFLERSMGNLGFAYVFEIELTYPVYRLKTNQTVLTESAAITNRGVTIT